MKFTVCPFCGVVSESPHDSQEACIQALQSEIDRTRRVLIQFGEVPTPGGVQPSAKSDRAEEPQES